jgi:ssDNA-binding Zn-finger/Zn-ribbon topoisomerase 1
LEQLASLILPIVLFFCFLAFLKLFLTKIAKNFATGLKNTALSSFAQYQKIDELFTPAERSFLGVLEQSLNNEYRVFGKVRLGDVIKPKRGLSNSLFYTALNKVNKKHVDFVVCRKNDCKVLGIIELDDRSHERADRKKRDQFVDTALNEAGVPILHFSAKMSYPVKEVRASLVNAFSLWMDGTPQEVNDEFRFSELPGTTTTPDDEWSLGEVVEKEAQRAEDAQELCPDCGSVMKAKKVSKGPHQGKFFFVCAKYPKCKMVKRVTQKVA